MIFVFFVAKTSVIFVICVAQILRDLRGYGRITTSMIVCGLSAAITSRLRDAIYV